MELPFGEVPDKPCAFDVINPTRLGLHDSIDYTDRKQDVRLALGLFI